MTAFLISFCCLTKINVTPFPAVAVEHTFTFSFPISISLVVIKFSRSIFLFQTFRIIRPVHGSLCLLFLQSLCMYSILVFSASIAATNLFFSVCALHYMFVFRFAAIQAKLNWVNSFLLIYCCNANSTMGNTKSITKWQTVLHVPYTAHY